MKKRLRNLRSSLLIAITSLLLALILVYSIISASYFIDGADTLNASLLFEARDHYAPQIDSGQPIVQPTIFHLKIETDPAQLPDYVRQAIAPGTLKINRIKVLPFHRGTSSSFAGIIFLLKSQTPRGHIIYLMRSLPDSEMQPQTMHQIDGSLYHLIIIGGTAVILCMILLIMLFRSVARPVQKLLVWAGDSENQHLDEPLPNFHYQEIDHLARLLRDSLQTSRQAIEREHNFLRHASHELRTPLTIISGNLQLLRRFSPPDTPLESTVFGRIERATKHMSQLTETLLWLSRDENYPLAYQTLALEQQIQTILDEHKNFIEQSDVKVDLDLAPCTLKLPRTPCLMVLSNLIRNAYQHGSGGQMMITLTSAGVVTLSNQRTDKADDNQSEDNFGLGLQLVEKLCHRFGWQLEQHQSGDQWISQVDFNQTQGVSSLTINSGLDGK